MWLVLDVGSLGLSLDECTEFTILGCMTMVVQGLLSFHHLKKLGKFYLATVTATAVAKSNHDKAGSSHTYVRWE